MSTTTVIWYAGMLLLLTQRGITVIEHFPMSCLQHSTSSYFIEFLTVSLITFITARVVVQAIL